MKAQQNVAAIMAVALFVTLGCGTPPITMDPDSGVVDGDTGVPPNPSDAGTDVDSDVPPPDGGGNVCTPTETDPLCSSAPAGATCQCDVSYTSEFCGGHPQLCAPGEGRNVCEADVSNRCGFDLPMSMASYSYEEFRHDCEPYIDFDYWFDFSETLVQTTWFSGQLTMLIHGRPFTCGNGGKCYANWANAQNPDPEIGAHATITFSANCEGMTEERFHGGETVPYDTVRYVFDHSGT